MHIKSIAGTTCACLAVASFSSYSALIDRGNGLIYDDDLDITWLQDANYAKTSGYTDSISTFFTDGRMSWTQAQTWANQLDYAGFTDWRLPTAPNIDLTCSNQNATYSAGDSCTGSEMGHLFYDELNNPVQVGFSNINTGPFIFSETVHQYWTGSLFTTNNDLLWLFDFHNGYTQFGSDTSSYAAWAVHDGDIGTSVVPIPAAIWLFISGLISLISISRYNPNAT